MNRRMFSKILAGISSAAGVGITFAKEKVFRQKYDGYVPILPMPGMVYMSVSFVLEHTAPVRYAVGSPGQPNLCEGLIGPLQPSLPGQTRRRYAIQSLVGMKATLPIMITLSSEKPMGVVEEGTQITYRRPI